MNREATGAPFFFATDSPPTATAVDDDIYLTVTTAVPDFSGRVESIDIVLSLDYASAAIAELSSAVMAARRNATALSRRRTPSRA